MSDDSMRAVLIALGAGVGVALAKVGAAVFTGSSAMAAEASHSLSDTANDLFLFIAQRRSSRHPDDRYPLGYGREAYFWALIAALGVFVAGAAFSLREGIAELIHPSATSSFAVAYAVLAVSAVFDLVSFRQSAGQMILRGRRYSRGLIDESKVTSDPTLRAVFLEDAVSVSGDVVALAALALNLNLRRVPRAGKRVDLRKRSYSQVWLLATSAGRARLRRAVRTHVLALV